MKHIFILNRFGNNYSDQLVGKIKRACEYYKYDYVIEINSDTISTEDILKKYQNTEDIIFAVGGDGMINRVLNGIVGTKNILGYIPYGTGNDFHKTVKETLDESINKVDLIRINDKYFINVACFGIDADIANDDSFVHNQFIPQSQRYNAGVIYHFLKYKPKNLEVIIDGEVYNQDFTTVILANARYYGNGYKVGTNSLVNDGLLDVYLIDKLNKIAMAKLILGMNKGKHENSKHIKKFLTKDLIIKGEQTINGNIDGEKISENEYNISVIPEGIEVYCYQDLAKRILKK